MKLALPWTKHITDKSKLEEFEKTVMNSTVLANRLYDVLTEMETADAKTSPVDYDSPSWSHKQADKNGALRALRQVKQLFNYLNR
jgi:hypothetical protein